MGTVFSGQNPHKLVDQIVSTLKSNEKYISIDLNEHHIPNHKNYEAEHYIHQTFNINRINALMTMAPELQAKKLASIQKALKSIRSKSSTDFFKFDLENSATTKGLNDDLCYKCSQFLTYETNGSIIRPTTKCSNATLEPVVVELNIVSGRIAIVRDNNMGSHYLTVDDIDEIKALGTPTIGFTYEASQLITKKTSATKKQVVILNLDSGYRTWVENNDIKIGLYQQPEPDAEEEPSQVENDVETESNADAVSTTSVSSSRKRKAKRSRKFVPRKRARMPSVLDCSSIVIMDYNDFEERGIDRKDLIEVFRVQPGLYQLTSSSELLRMESRHGIAVQITRTGDVIEEDDE